MSRIPNAVKDRYVRKDPDDNRCFFCGGHGAMDELTPSPKASTTDLESFTEDYTLVRSCRKCWSRIYTANIAYGGAQFGVPPGCMTLDQKTELIGVKAFRRIGTEAKFMIGFEKQFVVPVNTVRAGSIFITQGHQLLEEEMVQLQGAFALKLLGLPEALVELSLHNLLRNFLLDPEKEPIYRKLLDMESLDAASAD